MEFCQYKGCYSLDTRHFRKTPQDVARFLCRKHAKEEGHTWDEKVAEPNYRSVDILGCGQHRNIGKWHKTAAQRAKEEKQPKVLPKRIEAELNGIVSTFTTTGEFAKFVGVTQSASVRRAIRLGHKCKGYAVRYAMEKA